ncbi:kinesin-like protein KIF21B isoform X2 [Uranotaenia lowii]|uniref:kinesin-like protein KIF21B isoform X2 n=1 Tax=Uranotaenia lowii TaxID=190385 RepID=UPI00247AB5D3|nr:kinesin-like protein KIF21B isoform X2 [Uranotaenia lowii]
MSDDDKESSVRVAVRIRPQIPRELIDMCRVCTQVTPGEPQVFLGSDKAFTFDHVFDMNATQVTLYASCVEKLIEGALKGYNATVLAYGQTGSGKTYTMGTGFERDLSEVQEGIIPRAVRHLFEGITQLQENPYDDDGVFLGSLQFSVAAQFMELYNEEIIDLLDPYSKGRIYKIHEDASGGISVAGATIKPLTGPQDAMRCLQQGALARTTASTQMNEQSSRSHALFTILIRRQRVMSAEECGNPEGDLETLTSKFHFVDLAGSERLKRTGATGERAREGISINCGLLALGNVISALGDKAKKVTHVPYRDSKLTRLLQDSLGGNSQTIMIACVSPSDRDFMETLNTLKYANRARNIKNKVQINQDQSSRTISQLRREIAALQLELLEYKQGKRNIDSEGNAAISDTFLENAMLMQDNKRLQQRLKAMQETINTLTDKNATLQAQYALSGWSSGSTAGHGSGGENSGEDGDGDGGRHSAMQQLVAGYISEIEKLKAKLIESEQMFQQLKKAQASPSKIALKSNYSFIENTTETVINMAKRELEKERELLMSRSLPGLENESSQNSLIDEATDTDSDTESDDKTGELQAEIYDISSDIEIKTKLIEQLELSQQRMQVMRQQYEDKLNVLNAKIVSTQKERDQVLANMSGPGVSSGGVPNDRVRKVKEEYERKLNEMQRELRKLQMAQREHLRQQRELQAQDAQLKTLRGELTELKQIKIRLMRKIQDENNKHKELESRKTREIAQLRKESRKQVNMIKSLQAQGAAKDQVLKRKTEEVSNLRKSQRGVMSMKVAGRFPNNKSNALQNTKNLNTKWDMLQRTITRAARSRQAVLELERELERLLQERDGLSRDLANIRSRRGLGDPAELVSEEDTVMANMNYIQENITQIQHSIMELEEGKESASEQHQMQNILESIRSMEEAKFVLEKLTGASISHVCDAAVTQTRLKEREALLNEVQQDSSIQQQLLQHILSKTPAATLSDTSFSSANSNNMTINSMLHSAVLSNGDGGNTSGYDDRSEENGQYVINTRTRSPSPSSSTEINSSKLRRRPSAVGGSDSSPGGGRGYLPEVVSGGSPTTVALGNKLEKVGICIYMEDSADDDDTNKHSPQDENGGGYNFGASSMSGAGMTRSYTAASSSVEPTSLPVATSHTAGVGNGSASASGRSFIPLSRVPSAPGSLKGLQPVPSISRQNSTASPLLTRKSFEPVAPSSPRISRRAFPNKTSPGIEDSYGDTPTSPPVFRRGTSRDDTTGDVFSRLGAGTQDPSPGGHIKEYTGRLKAGSPLICTHVVEGHSNSVLSIRVSNQTLFTAAADRTVKVWDLRTGATPHCLTGHLGPVAAVECDRTNNLLFSASGAFIKVWDLRDSNIRPIITLCSSGSILPANASLSDLIPGECSITALKLGASGKLYTAASDKVRIWDLRTFSCLGRLSGGHQAAVMCLTAWEGPNNTDLVATGSKDHYVKVFEVNSLGGNVPPLLNLEPPHYDGVQALVVAKDAVGIDAELFSGSRDSGIKRWDLRNGELKQSLNNAHKGWVSGMAIYGDILLSSCRGGVIRLWNVKNCDSLAEMKTDQSINDIVTSDNRVFTASNTGIVRMWRFSGSVSDLLNGAEGGGVGGGASVVGGNSKLKR